MTFPAPALCTSLMLYQLFRLTWSHPSAVNTPPIYLLYWDWHSCALAHLTHRFFQWETYPGLAAFTRRGELLVSSSQCLNNKITPPVGTPPSQEIVGQPETWFPKTDPSLLTSEGSGSSSHLQDIYVVCACRHAPISQGIQKTDNEVFTSVLVRFWKTLLANQATCKFLCHKVQCFHIPLQSVRVI